jgi:hypothetical protein
VAYFTIPHTFTNLTDVVDATTTNANNSAVVNALSDGTKDININTATINSLMNVIGTATFSGANVYYGVNTWNAHAQLNSSVSFAQTATYSGAVNLVSSTGINFGSQAITTTGNITGAALIPSSSTVPTNGMYLSAANTIAFATNSTLAGTVNASQLWTIGGLNSAQYHSIRGLGFSCTSGTSTTADFEIYRDNQTGSLFLEGGTGSANSAQVRLYGSSHASLASITRFTVGSTVNMSISATGLVAVTNSVGIGGASAGTTYALVSGIASPLTTGTDIIAVGAINSAPSTATTGATGLYSGVTTANSSFTCGRLIGLWLDTNAKGASSTVTRRVGALIEPVTDGANNANLILGQSTLNFTGTWNIYSDSASANQLPGPTAIGGTITNDSAAAGYVGEYTSANPGAGVAVTTSGNYITIVSVSLTAGDWDVWGMAQITPGTGTAFVRMACSISLTNNAQDSQSLGGYAGVSATLGITTPMPTGVRRISIASTTTVYLVGRADYTLAGTAQWDTSSIIQARRAR